MPWVPGRDAGVMLVSFNRSPDALEAQLRPMVRPDDGATKTLFDISRALTGAHCWRPPMCDGGRDLRALAA